MDRSTNTDNWSSLLSQLGMETSREESVAEPAAEPFIVETSVSSVEEPPVPENTPFEEPKRSGESKRSFFDRFPKVNLFGSPPKDPLDAAVGGRQSTAKPTETFTSKKLEKVDPPYGRTRREMEPDVPPVSAPAPVSKGNDPWSLIASQVGNLAESEVADEPFGESPRVVTESADSETTKQDFGEEPPREKRRAEPPRRDRRPPPSMFDDAPVEESTEATAVRSILNAEEPKPFADAAERLSSIFGEPPTRNDKEPERHEHRRHVRGQRSDEFRQETSRERNFNRPNRETDDDQREEERNVSERKFDNRKREERSLEDRTGDEPRPRPERGQRGTRYGKREHFETERSQGSRGGAPPEREPIPSGDDDFKTGSIWDVEEESKPVERSGRRRSRHPERREQGAARSTRIREERESVTDLEDVTGSAVASSGKFEQIHRNIPSWDDAISAIIEANVARHSKRVPDQRRGRGVRS